MQSVVEQINDDLVITIPDPILAKSGLEPGDKVDITVSDKGTMIITKIELINPLKSIDNAQDRKPSVISN